MPSIAIEIMPMNIIIAGYPLNTCGTSSERSFIFTADSRKAAKVNPSPERSPKPIYSPSVSLPDEERYAVPITRLLKAAIWIYFFIALKRFFMNAADRYSVREYIAPITVTYSIGTYDLSMPMPSK